jgi:hypothetical protein
MSLAWTLRTKKLGNFAYMQWIIIIFLFIVALVVINHFIQEALKPSPETINGFGDGVFHGGRNFFCAECTTPELQQQNCYSDSKMFFWGNITFNDTTFKDYTEEGAELNGEICLISVDQYIWSSTDQRHRTPIRFNFRGNIKPLPMLDPAPLIPWVGWGLTIALVFFLIRRKFRPPDFDAIRAERVFKDYVDAKGYTPLGPIESETQELVGGKEFTVSQLIEGPHAPRWLIMNVDNHRRILRKRFDDTGEVYRSTMGREALMFNKDIRKDMGKFTESDVYDQATKRLEDYFQDKEQTKKSKEQKAAETRNLMRKEAMMNTPAFPKAVNMEEE